MSQQKLTIVPVTLHTENEVRKLSQQEFRWLLEDLSLQQPKAIQKSLKSVF